ncbi:CidA/LrgA family protein, partial [Pseudomonas aeruginosa]|nr:CidA/LrgA family protein [Pseudomonas aeruginosa]
FIPAPIPASIYGLVILLVLLLTGIVKVGHIKETSDFLIAVMPLMFVPPAVGLMESWGVLSGELLPILQALDLAQKLRVQHDHPQVVEYQLRQIPGMDGESFRQGSAGVKPQQ